MPPREYRRLKLDESSSGFRRTPPLRQAPQHGAQAA
jgi:hypothetical protein